MKLVYPSNNHTTFAASTFCIGSVTVGQTLTLNGQPVALSAKGYFAQRLALAFGRNVFQFLTSDGSQRQLVVTRPAPVSIADGTIQPDRLPTPPMAVMPGDVIPLIVAAGPHQSLKAQWVGTVGTVLLEVSLTALGSDGLVDNRHAVFAELTQTQPLLAKPCLYQATAVLPACLPAMDHVRLHWLSPTQTVVDKADITLWDQPRFGRVAADRVVMRTSPPDGSRLSPQRQGAWVVITGRRGNWWRVRLSDERTAWLPVDKVEAVTSTPEPVANIPAQTLKTQPVSGKTHSIVSLPGLPHPVAHHVDSRPNGLTLDLFGMVSHCDFIHYHPQETVIHRIDWSQPNADTFRLMLTVPRLCGYDVSFLAEGARLLVKQLSRTPKILIDPGHGGAETGSTGPDGTPEKTLNLSLSQLTAEACRRHGLDVTLTRTQDIDLSLTARTDQAAGYDMVISLHHNALPDGRDPQTAQGLSVYYYHGMAKPLAQHLCDGLTNTLSVPNYGVFYDSLALTRIPDAMAVLIETGFMTHPQEYERLQSPAFQQRFAQALADQLVAFIRQG
jgi:N-acetylmuramoyl-L-alanine amidase